MADNSTPAVVDDDDEPQQDAQACRGAPPPGATDPSGFESVQASARIIVLRTGAACLSLCGKRHFPLETCPLPPPNGPTCIFTTRSASCSSAPSPVPPSAPLSSPYKPAASVVLALGFSFDASLRPPRRRTTLVLGEKPTAMARAVQPVLDSSAHLRSPSSSSPNTTFSVPSPFASSNPAAPPLCPESDDYGDDKSKSKPHADCFSPRPPMTSELSVSWHTHWLSRLRSALRLLVIVLSGAVVVFLVHTLEIYRGNTYLDLRKGELPMTWPAHTNLVPTLVLFAVAAAHLIASIALLGLSFTRSFRRPIRSRDLYRVVAGSFGVICWGAALAAFTLLDRASKASLGRYACSNKNVMSNGRFQYRAVCEEQVRHIHLHTWHSG